MDMHLPKGAVSLLSSAAAATFLLAHGVPAEASFPTDPDGRLTYADTSEYESAMLSGGPPKDGIPSIDKPEFWSVAEADQYLDPDDVVFGLVENGVARAYPQRVLVWHEIVNDTVGGENLAVTYCPLTGTALAFERGDTEFGVTGRLVNSNLVMYDRSTNTWFPQVLAVGIKGPRAGEALVERPLIWTTWERWKAAHPDTEVLSTQTGFARNYNHDPYGTYNPLSGYYAPDSPRMFPVMHEDTRFPAKSVFLGARTSETAVAFRLDSLRQDGQLTIEADGENFTAIYDPELDTGHVFRGTTDAEAVIDGTGLHAVQWIGDDSAPEPVNSFDAMWFAWTAFYPETHVHE